MWRYAKRKNAGRMPALPTIFVVGDVRLELSGIFSSDADCLRKVFLYDEIFTLSEGEFIALSRDANIRSVTI
jgi:hypothetical protein